MEKLAHLKIVIFGKKYKCEEINFRHKVDAVQKKIGHAKLST